MRLVRLPVVQPVDVHHLARLRQAIHARNAPTDVTLPLLPSMAVITSLSSMPALAAGLPVETLCDLYGPGTFSPWAPDPDMSVSWRTPSHAWGRLPVLDIEGTSAMAVSIGVT